MTDKHTKIDIDPSEFADKVPVDTDAEYPDVGEYIFNETDVLRFLIDEMNDAGVDISMIYRGYENAIEYHGKFDRFGVLFDSIGNTPIEDPESVLIDGMVELSHMLNNRKDTDSWVSYKYRKYVLHIQDIANVE